MLSQEQLQEKLLQLTFENKQLERFKFLNELILSGLDAILSSDHHQLIFKKLFAIIHEAIDCQHIALLSVNTDKHQAELLSSSTKHLVMPPIPLDQVTSLFNQTHNFFNVSLLPWWSKHFFEHFPQSISVLTHPFRTNQAQYVLMLFGNERGSFSKPVQELLSSFTSFVANTLTQVETRQLIKERDELKQRQQRIEQSLLQQEKMASLGQLAAGVAHELNNPLGFIYSNLNSLKAYFDKIAGYIEQTPFKEPPLQAAFEAVNVPYLLSDGRDLINESLEGARRARDIIQNLRNYSHPDEAKTVVIELHQLIENAVKMARTQTKHYAEINMEFDKGDCRILANPNQLNQVFLNLIINASQATIKGHGLINIKTQIDEHHHIVDIIDNGCGISDHAKEHIFEPFFTTKDVGQGTGLGLSLSKALTEQHGGQLHLARSDSSGSCFRITLPRAVV